MTTDDLAKPNAWHNDHYTVHDNTTESVGELVDCSTCDGKWRRTNSHVERNRRQCLACLAKVREPDDQAKPTEGPEVWELSPHEPERVHESLWIAWVLDGWGIPVARAHGSTPEQAEERARLVAAGPEMVEFIRRFGPIRQADEILAKINGGTG